MYVCDFDLVRFTVNGLFFFVFTVTFLLCWEQGRLGFPTTIGFAFYFFISAVFNDSHFVTFVGHTIFSFQGTVFLT